MTESSIQDWFRAQAEAKIADLLPAKAHAKKISLLVDAMTELFQDVIDGFSGIEVNGAHIPVDTARYGDMEIGIDAAGNGVEVSAPDMIPLFTVTR